MNILANKLLSPPLYLSLYLSIDLYIYINIAIFMNKENSILAIKHIYLSLDSLDI